MLRWRVGRKVGRTIYEQRNSEPSDDDNLIGLMDTRELAQDAVEAHNRPEIATDTAAYWQWKARDFQQRVRAMHESLAAESGRTERAFRERDEATKLWEEAEQEINRLNEKLRRIKA